MKEIANYKSVLELEENDTASVGYLMAIGALLLIVTERENKFIGFHARQSVLLSITYSIILLLMTAVFNGTSLGVAVALASVLWLVSLAYMALMCYFGNSPKLPIISKIAEKWTK